MRHRRHDGGAQRGCRRHPHGGPAARAASARHVEALQSPHPARDFTVYRPDEALVRSTAPAHMLSQRSASLCVGAVPACLRSPGCSQQFCRCTRGQRARHAVGADMASSSRIKRTVPMWLCAFRCACTTWQTHVLPDWRPAACTTVQLPAAPKRGHSDARLLYHVVAGCVPSQTR